MTPDFFIAHIPTRQKIIKAMTEPHRVYHTLSHAFDVAWLGFGEKGPIFLGEQDLFFYNVTAFYHDIVYVPGAEDNEYRSAQELVKDIHLLNFGPEYIIEDKTFKDAYKAILLSKDHFAPEAYIDVSDRIGAFLDNDVWGLGAEPDQYDINTKKIRLEYANVSDEEWTIGRKKWINKALDAQSIYRRFVDREKQARINLKREQKSLG